MTAQDDFFYRYCQAGFLRSLTRKSRVKEKLPISFPVLSGPSPCVFRSFPVLGCFSGACFRVPVFGCLSSGACLRVPVFGCLFSGACFRVPVHATMDHGPRPWTKTSDYRAGYFRASRRSWGRPLNQGFSTHAHPTHPLIEGMSPRTSGGAKVSCAMVRGLSLIHI